MTLPPGRSLRPDLLLGALASAGLLGVLAASAGRRVLGLAAVAVANLVAIGLMVRRARSSTREHDVWVRWAAAAGCVSVSGALGQLGAPWAAALVAVPAFLLGYGAVVRWNRYATSLADPHELMNGVAAVAAALALADLVAGLTGSAAGLSLPDRLVAWTPPAAAGILLASSLTIVPVAGLTRDLRAWAMCLATAAVAVAAVVPSAGLDPRLGMVGLAIAALAAGTASCLPVWHGPIRPVAAADSTVGGFAVMVVSIGFLVVAALHRLDGLVLWASAAAGVLSSVRLLRNVRDISALSESRQLALTDDLTGIGNRRALMQQMGDLVARREPFVLAVVDLDGFKRVNDGLGHAAGDQLLVQVAGRLRASAHAGDLVARTGGDEFAVLAPLPVGTGPATVAHAGARLGADLVTALTEPADVTGFLVRGSASVGLTSAGGTTGWADAEELLRQADAALYDAKTTRATSRTYDPGRHAHHGQLFDVEDLRTALEQDQLLLHYQPQVEIVTGRLVGVEALVRWQHPTRGLLPPVAFIPLAEAHGLVGCLTDRVLDRAVAQLAAWHHDGWDLTVSVNLSGSDLLDTALPDRVAALIARHGAPAAALVLEITEGVLVPDDDNSAAVLAGLTALGVRLSIDDFGTGFSSLAYLRRLPVDELKLDAAFTREVVDHPRTAAIVGSTIELAHRLGMQVVAEGVEDAATADRLAELACDRSQGYLYARPLPATDLVAWARLRAAAAVPAS